MRRPKTHLAQNVRKDLVPAQHKCRNNPFHRPCKHKRKPKPKECLQHRDDTAPGALTLGERSESKKQCRATTAAGIVKKSRNENMAPVAIDQRISRLVKTRAFGAESKRRLMQDIMMSATKNEMHSSRSPITLKNRLVENNRIARKPNVNGFENRFRKAT